LDRGEFQLYYQPIIELASGEVVGAEALVRLVDAEGALRTPSEFVSMAEETGLIAQLGRTVLATAAIQLKKWDSSERGPLTVSVNVSPRQLADSRFATSVAADLATCGLDPSRMTLELTESALIDANPVTEKVLGELTDLGVLIGLDDFGTGFSSLAYLKRFPINFVKIDQSFVDGLGLEDDDTAIVRATIALAHSLGLKVTAEGVETKIQHRYLRDLGCDRAQGNLVGQTVPAKLFDPSPRP
jgi:EAL domain-containing protein (putative c-di-GMP-specific phosphodiesterase class I)